ncbi:MAG: ABC transporter ATP-binding protein [Deltaproteobacteria bacterium]|nr:ABC transporter ATP-binding protein [Deltaproteobacteria bacterium]
MKYLSLKSISKVYSNVAGQDAWILDNINLELEHGDILALLGSSGCGKTTLLRLITGLERLDNGSVFLNDEDITQLPTHKRHFGMMFQDFALFPHKTVYENIAFGLEINELFSGNKKRIADRVEEVLSLVNLSHTANRYIQDLSGGEKQRIALARTLAPKPKLILLDEPLGSLDRALREELMFELRDILKLTQMTAIFVTHDQTEAFSIADKIAVMDKGKIVQINEGRTLYFKPKNKKVAAFLGFKNLFDTMVDKKHQVKTPFGIIDIQPKVFVSGEKVTALIRPESAKLIGEKAPIQLGQLLIKGILTSVTFLGGYYQIRILLDSGEKLYFKFQNQVNLPETNSEIFIVIEKKDIEIIHQ